MATTRRLVVLVLLGAAIARAEHLPARVMASEALALCEAADTASPSERLALLSRGLDHAEHALHADPQDATAHFAVFCNLGKRTDLERRSRGFVELWRDLARVRREIDDTLALAPDYPAALAGKGRMLMELPRMFGGDPEEGRRLLRRAVTLDPSNDRARSLLADVDSP